MKNLSKFVSMETTAGMIGIFIIVEAVFFGLCYLMTLTCNC